MSGGVDLKDQIKCFIFCKILCNQKNGFKRNFKPINYNYI